MYGLIGRMLAVPGRRDELLAIMLAGQVPMRGCRSYVIARDAANADALWITEIWDSAESHRLSLSIPEVQQTIARARPLIAGFDHRFETEPVAGLPGEGGA